MSIAPPPIRHALWTLDYSLVSRVVVHSRLIIGPQPTVVQERK